MRPSAAHLRLQTLLDYGIAIDLPDEKRLYSARLQPDFPESGASLAQIFPEGNANDADLLAAARAEVRDLLERHGSLDAPELGPFLDAARARFGDERSEGLSA